MKSLTTDSRFIIPIKEGIEKIFSIQEKNSTIGSKEAIDNYLPITTYRTPYDNVLEKIQNIQNTDVKNRAKTLLYEYLNLVNRFYHNDIDLSPIPQLNIVSPGDESILMEWVSNQFRIGINVESGNLESNWYLVSTSSLGDIEASGYLTELNKQKTILWLLCFILLDFNVEISNEIPGKLY